MIRVLVADGHEPRRAGLRSVVEAERGMSVIATATSGLEAVALAVARRADVVLLDAGFPPPMSTSEAIGAITARAGHPRVVVIPERGGWTATEVIRSIRAAARGESPAATDAEMDADKTTPVHLSEREREVLAAVASGASNRDAAAMLFISESTVKSHLSHAYGKLGVDSRVDAVAQARQRGLLGA